MATPLNVEDTQNSSLLALPAELRNEIYHFVLLHKGEVRLDFKIIHAATNIIRVSSQLRTEAKIIFYAGNRFIIKNSERQQHHVKRFLADSEDMRRHLSIIFNPDPPSVWITANKLCRRHMEAGLPFDKAAEEVAKGMGTAERSTFQEIVTGSIVDRRDAGIAIAKILVEAGIPWTNIFTRDHGDPETSRSPHQKSGRVFVRGFIHCFKKAALAARSEIEKAGE